MQQKQDMLMFNVIIINTDVVHITMNLIIMTQVSFCVLESQEKRRRKKQQQQPTGKITRF